MTKGDDMKPISKKRNSYVYPPSIWDHNFVQSLRSDYTKESKYGKRAEKLKDGIRRMFINHQRVAGGTLPLANLLKLINDIQKLGIDYHFDDEITGVLEAIVKDKHAWQTDNLFLQALRFRLLRQHGYEVSQDVLKSFTEDIKASGDVFMKLCIENNKCVEDMLSVYEASFYAFKGENILEEAQKFTSRVLKEYISLVEEDKDDEEGHGKMGKRLVSHALELPFRWTMQKLESRWFIDTYEMRKEGMDPLLLEFAKLDYNIVQANYQEELKYISRWWQELGYLDTLKFSRDRWTETFFWSVGSRFEPKFANFRRQFTKLSIAVTTVDDMYDIYGSPDELKMFTDAVERWDIYNVEDLPYYMKICFIALYNTTNDMAYEILLKHGFHCISYLKDAIVDFCVAQFEEAKSHEYIPTLEEHLNNTWRSVSGSVLSTVAYLMLEKEPTKEALEHIKNFSLSDVRRCSYSILRLLNDLETSSEELGRGAPPTSVQCYMHETGASESAAREHIKNVVSDLWKEMNQDIYSRSIFPQSFTDALVNVGRTSHCLYQFGDGYGVSPELLKDRVTSLFFEPIPITSDIIA
ncbi:hypothetical protein MKW94_019990 [Papaver nudicaule]|uniref:Uncharacterized protein n=1 Tax=Papaver nudicaule TaxID=74823 RepID=A0AA42AXA1_PAPNU|nr:hypothetical protein [Papaver nudicaule]